MLPCYEKVTHAKCFVKLIYWQIAFLTEVFDIRKIINLISTREYLESI